MKKIPVYIFGLLAWISCVAQLPSGPDTLSRYPVGDTVKGTKKLPGGALIDTIHTKKNKYQGPVQSGDTIHKPKRIRNQK